MQHRNIKIYFCNIIMKYLQRFFETTETRQTFACNIGVKPGILTSEQFAARRVSPPQPLGSARPAQLTPGRAQHPSSVLGGMQPVRPLLRSATPWQPT
jgi:hypothetical protein